jgi:hypothetical protein
LTMILRSRLCSPSTLTTQPAMEVRINMIATQMVCIEFIDLDFLYSLLHDATIVLSDNSIADREISKHSSGKSQFAG